jgi:hypothetical protein
LAKKLRISESFLHNGVRPEKRRLERTVQILKRPAAYFARENALPNQYFRQSVNTPTLS